MEKSESGIHGGLLKRFAGAIAVLAILSSPGAWAQKKSGTSGTDKGTAPVITNNKVNKEGEIQQGNKLEEEPVVTQQTVPNTTGQTPPKDTTGTSVPSTTGTGQNPPASNTTTPGTNPTQTVPAVTDANKKTSSGTSTPNPQQTTTPNKRVTRKRTQGTTHVPDNKNKNARKSGGRDPRRKSTGSGAGTGSGQTIQSGTSSTTAPGTTQSNPTTESTSTQSTTPTTSGTTNTDATEEGDVPTGGGQASFQDLMRPKKTEPATGTTGNFTAGATGTVKTFSDLMSPQKKKTDADNSTQSPEGKVGTTAGKSCSDGVLSKDEALRKIHEFVLKDKGEVLAAMFELTAVRLAKRAAQQGATTVEDRAKADVALIEQRLQQLHGAEEIKNSVTQLYGAYQMPADAALIEAQLTSVKTQGKDACYFAKTKRFNNLQSSAWILAVVAGEEGSGLSETDAATVWVVEKLRAEAEAAGKPGYALGKEYGNLLNVTTRAARYLGRIAGGKKLDKDQLGEEILAREGEIAKAIGGAVEAVKKELADCLNKRRNCTSCANAEVEAFMKELSDVNRLQSSLLQAVTKDGTAKMIEGLQGQMGEVTFDFSNYVKSGEIGPDTRRGKVDACGRPLKARSPAKKKN